MLLHLVRHGAHVLPDGILAGRSPGVHLSELGRAQAEALARRLAGTPLAAVYASPLERTRETAAAIALPHKLPVRECPEAIEIDFGAWMQKSFAELENDELWRRWNKRRSLARCPGGESMAAVQARMIDGMATLARCHEDQAVAVVSHGDVIKAALAWWLGVPLDLFQRIDVAVGSLALVELFDNRPPLVRSIGEAPTSRP